MRNEIFIHTDQGSYVAGEVIYGNVFLNILHPVAAKSLFLEIVGYEKAEWQYEEVEWYDEDGQRKSRTIIKERKAEGDFFKDRFTLIDYPGGYPVGQFSYPFQYRLPDNLPGVFEKKRKKGLKLKAKIRYKIKAVVDIAHTKHDLICKQHLIIHEQLDKKIEPKHFMKEITVRTLCCIPRGPVKCEAFMNKNCYMAGETAQIHVKVENNSTVEVNHFNSKLIRHITLLDKHGHTREISDVVAMQKYPGTAPHSNKAQDIPLPLFGRHSRLIQPSTNSRVIKCKYYVMIELDIPWAPDLEIQVPVIIYAPQNALWQNWHPPTWFQNAQLQKVNSQLAVPSDVLELKMKGGYFQGPVISASFSNPSAPPEVEISYSNEKSPLLG